MLSLIHLKEEAYGAKIRQLLDEQVTRVVAIGAIYSTLEHLARKNKESNLVNF